MPRSSVSPRRERNTAETFWAQVAPSGSCMVWTGGGTSAGYGQLRWQGRRVYAHRLAFYLREGRWPEPLIRHLCGNRRCVLHIVEGTAVENMRDCVEAGTHGQARKTACKRGHPFTPENTYINPSTGGRTCRACRGSGRTAPTPPQEAPLPRSRQSHNTRDRLRENVRERRALAGLTQLDLALEMGVSPSAVYWLEREGRHSPDTLDAAARALGCTPSELLA